MKYQEWLNGCGCCPDIQDCPPSTGIPCDCDSILLELSKQHTDDLVLQEEIDNLDEKKLDASAYTPVDLTDYYTKEEVDELIPSLDGYATEEWVNEQGFLKTVEPLKTINGESLIGEGDIVISGGSGDVYTKAETDSKLADKQDKLTAGSGISISYNNVISVTGGGESSGVTSGEVMDMISGYTYDKDTIDNKIAGGGTFDPTLYYKKSETSGKTEIQNALDLKLDASAFTESDYYKKSETSGKTELDAEFDKYYKKSETSGKTELSNEFALYYKKTETSSKTEIDDALLLDSYEDYKTKNTYTSAFPSLTETADWNGAIQGGVYARHSDFWDDDSYQMSFKLQVIDENGNTFSAATSNITERRFTVNNVNPLPDYIDVVRPTYEESPYYGRVLASWIFKPKDGYRISYAEINSYWEDEFRRHNNITEIEWYDAFPSGYTKDIIENYIEPKLANAQEKLTFEENVKLMGSEGKSVPYVPTDYAISDWYSGSTNPVQTKAVYNYTYSKAETDAKLADKQDKLTAGSGISISNNNVISATGGGVSYSAGTGIDITNNVISSTLNAYNGTGVGSLIIGQSANTASGDYSVAVGAQTEALGGRSFAQGLSGKTTNTAEITFGQLNDTKNAYSGFGHSGNTLFTVGNGAGIDGSTTDYARHNAFEVRSNGDIYIPEPSKVNPSHYYQAPMIKLQDRLNEIDNKPNIWCGDSQAWSQISGSTESGTLYLIY
jgi:hypothetical protein